MRTLIILALYLAAVNAVPSNPQKIIGGSVTTIDQYPSIVALLWSPNLNTYWQSCGGTILNDRTILTAAHCPEGDPVLAWRVRVGSSWASSGGVVHSLTSWVIHPNYHSLILDYDFAIMRTTVAVTLNNNAQPGVIAGSNYNVADNAVVYAAGWGYVQQVGPSSEQLRHVQVWVINQNICRQRYAGIGRLVTDNMICSGWLDVGGRDQCQGDSGGPLYHNNVVVGVCSWGRGCASFYFPGVSARVSSVTPWIQANA